jgi:predicted ATPase/DNA-binding SARP family transcriptional activator
MSEVPQLLRLLGEPGCIVGGTARRIGGPPRTLALLLFLVLNRDKPLERRRIAFTLWPDADEEEALANLRRHLHALAQALPPRADHAPWFETGRYSVRWIGDAAVDVTALEAAFDARDDERAVALYGGALCTAIDEAWADVERERLERLVLQALDRLIERDRPRDTQRAIGWAARALAIDPWRESAVRALIELHAIAGDAASARRQYHEFVERLAREYDAAPAPETTQAFDRIASRSPPRGPRQLPDYLPPMLGREDELAQVCSLLASAGLVTIAGHGGVGKTRLAIAAGKALAGAFADGVTLCELAPIADPTLVASTIASAAGIAHEGSADIAVTIGAHLGDRLLIIDNCEHLLAETARVVDAILRNAPSARLLATSREPLRLRRETLLRLEPLGPDAAVELFAARAKAANPRFRLSTDVLPVVTDVCRRLDGNALAIELAAARLTVLSVHRIRSQLDARFELLVNGKRDVVAHQRALRASLDWSYGLLDERQKSIFAKVGVFAGIFTLGSAVALCSDLAEADVIETLGALVEKSLVVAVDADDEPRFRLLESVRLYARNQLELAGESAAMRTRHLATVGAAFEAVRDLFAATPRESLFLELAPLLDDARLALDWALRSGPQDVAQGVRLLCATKLWDRLRIGREGLAYAEALLARLGPDTPALEAELWRFISFVDDRQTMGRTIEAGDRSVALARAAGDLDLVAASLAQRAFIAIRFRRFAEATRDLHEAQTIAPVTAARRLLLLAGRAFMASLEGRLDEAARGQMAILETHRFLGNRTGERYATTNVAEIEHLRGNTQRALELLRPFVEGLDGRTLELGMRVNHIGYLLALDNVEAARAAASEAIAVFAETAPGTMFEAMVFGHSALIGAIDGDVRGAARVAAYVDECYRTLGMTREYTEELVHDKLVAIIDAALSPADRAAEETEGRSWSRERARYEAQRSCGLPPMTTHAWVPRPGEPVGVRAPVPGFEPRNSSGAAQLP